jgi:ribonuclease J
MRIAAEETSLPAPDHRFPDIRVYYPHKLTKRINNKGGKKALYAFPGRKVIYGDISDSPGKYFLLVRPSSRSWMNHIPLDGAVLLYSLWSGYKKKPGNKVFLDFLEQSGCGISTLHTSGHADAETIMETITVLKPEKILPVHTMNPEWFDSSRPEVVHLNNSESLTI